MTNNKFKTLGQRIAAALFVVGALFFAQGCERDGPLEEAAEDIDNAIRDAGDEMEDAAYDAEDQFQDAANEAEQAFDDAADAMEDAADEIQRN